MGREKEGGGTETDEEREGRRDTETDEEDTDGEIQRQMRRIGKERYRDR
jgi:hypothetical protein